MEEVADDTKMSKAQHVKPAEGLHHCENCDKFYEYIDMSTNDRDHCRFCSPHCSICLGEKHLNEFWDLDALDVLCIGCQQRVIRTCEKCHKTFRDWLQEEADKCEECAELTDESDSD